MIPDFNPCDPATWRATLTIEQVAAIYQRSVVAIRKVVQRKGFVPCPFEQHPYRWRKVDVLRHVEGARMPLRRSA